MVYSSPPDFIWLRQQLERYTYKPDWLFKIDFPEREESFWSPAMLTVKFEAIDSRDPDRRALIWVGGRYAIPAWVTEFGDEQAFAEFMQRTIWAAEEHESREWLRRDGQILDDPHKRPT